MMFSLLVSSVSVVAGAGLLAFASADGFPSNQPCLSGPRSAKVVGELITELVHR
jgi:hypothetical protein